MRLLALCLLLIATSAARAQDLDADQHEKLARILIQLETLDSLTPNDEIRARKSALLGEASQVTSLTCAETERVRVLVAAPPRSGSYVDFLDVLWVFVGLTITLALAGIGVVYLGPHVKHVPPELLEALGWCASVACIFGGPWVVRPIVAFIAAILGLLVFGLVSSVRFGKLWRREGRPLLLTWAAVLAAAALLHRSHFFGLLAVASLLAGLGACVLEGLLSHRAPSGLVASGLLLIGAAALRLKVDPEWFRFFEASTWWLAGTAFAASLLTLSSRYYDRGRLGVRWVCWQVVSIAAGVAALWIGHVLAPRLDSAVLQEVGGTFLALFFLEKLADLPWKSRHWPWIALAVGLSGFAAVSFAARHPEYFLGL